MNIAEIVILTLVAHWSDCVDRNDKVFTLLYVIIYIKIVMHKKMAHPYEIQNTYVSKKILLVFIII